MCDAPTEACGNCWPYSIVQQAHRPEIWSTLPDDIKPYCNNSSLLRQAIVRFVKEISPESDYFDLIDDCRTQYTILSASDDTLDDWDTRLDRLAEDGCWFDDQTMKFTACFLKTDIICYTSTQDLKYCGSSMLNEANMRPDSQCSCQCEHRECTLSIGSSDEIM